MFASRGKGLKMVVGLPVCEHSKLIAVSNESMIYQSGWRDSCMDRHEANDGVVLEYLQTWREVRLELELELSNSKVRVCLCACMVAHQGQLVLQPHYFFSSYFKPFPSFFHLYTMC